MSNVGMNLFRHGHENIMLSEIFYFVALFARAAKKTHQHSKYLYQAKILVLTHISGDMEIARQIQTVIPANCRKVFCLSQDGEWTNFFYSRRP
jgi:hypothetical protein